MSLDLTDPTILQVYDSIISGQAINWLLLGDLSSDDTLSLFACGKRGLKDMVEHLTKEILYGFLRFENYFVLISYISDQVSGVRRVKGLVQARQLATLFKEHQVQLSVSSIGEITEAKIRARISLMDETYHKKTPHSSIEDGSIDQNHLTSLLDGRKSVHFYKKKPTPPPVPEFTPMTIHLKPTLSQELGQSIEPKSESKLASRIAAFEGSKKIDLKSPDKTFERNSIIKIKDKANEKAFDYSSLSIDSEGMARALTPPLLTPPDSEKLVALQTPLRISDPITISHPSPSNVSLAGYVSVQTGNSSFWKRRWFMLKKNSLYLFHEQKDKYPIIAIDLSDTIETLEDAEEEVLIPNSFKLQLQYSGCFFFYLDDLALKNSLMKGIREHSAS